MAINQELLNRLNQLTSEKNYKALAELLNQSCEKYTRSDNGDDRGYSETLREYCKRDLVNLTRLGTEKHKIVQGNREIKTDSLLPPHIVSRSRTLTKR